MTTPPDNEVRRLRDNVYGSDAKYCSDNNWEACKAHWLEPEQVKWLREQPQNREAK